MKNYYEDYWQREHPPPANDPLAPERTSLFWQQVESAGLTSGAVLDAGCGEGRLVADAAARGFNATGMDISEHAMCLARERHPECTFFAHSVEEVPWPVDAGSFNIVASFEVIEHLLHPSLLIRGASQALRRGGFLAISTPYHGFLKNLVIATTAFDRHYAVEGDHIRFFSDSALRKMLARHGFATDRIVHYGRFRGFWAGSFVWARKVGGP